MLVASVFALVNANSTFRPAYLRRVGRSHRDSLCVWAYSEVSVQLACAVHMDVIDLYCYSC